MKEINKQGILEYYCKQAYHDSPDSQLEAAKAFGRYCDEKSKQRKVILEGGLDAILHLTSSDSVQVVLEAMTVLTLLCSVKDFARDLVIERDCFSPLANLVVHHDVKVQSMAAQCIGHLGQHRYCTKKLVSQGALLPLLGLMRVEVPANLLLEVCRAVSKLYLNYDYALRIVNIWGVVPLKDIILTYQAKLQEFNRTSCCSDLKQERKNLERKDLYENVLIAVSSVLKNYSTCDKIAYFMVHESSIDILTQLDCIMLRHDLTEVRRLAAKVGNHLTQQKACRPLIVKHSILRRWIEITDTDYDTRHHIAKSLSNLCEFCDGEEIEIEVIRSQITMYANINFMDAMIKSIGCIYIQRMALEVLIQGGWICKEKASLFSRDFIASVINVSQNSIDLQIKRMCGEVLYFFSRIPEFHSIIVNEGSEMLIPHLVFKDVVSKTWSLKILAQVGETQDMLPILKQAGIILPAIKCFLMTSNRKTSDQVVLYNNVRILAMLSDFGSLRQNLLQLENGQAFNKLLDVFDRSLQEREWGMITLCLRIFISFINNANREGSGNANLKLISEKRLNKLVEYTFCDNFKTSSMIIDTLVAYSQHNNVPISDFWANKIEKLAEMCMCGGNYRCNIYQREEMMKALLSIMRKNHIHTSLRIEKLLEIYFSIFLGSRSFSMLKLYSSQTLLFFCKTYPRFVQTALPKYRMQLNDHQKQFKFFYGLDQSEDNNCLEHLMLNLDKYLSHFDKERKKYIRKYLILNKLKRSIIALSKYQKENEANAKEVSNLLAEAQRDESEAANVAALLNEYVPLRHKHHYDDGLATIFRKSYQPNSMETRNRMEELIFASYKPSSTPVQNSSTSPEKATGEALTPAQSPSITLRTNSTSSLRSVSYNPQQHKKKKSQSDMARTMKPAEEKFVSQFDTMSDSIIERNMAKLLSYTRITYKPKEERTREDVPDRIKRRYLQRSSALKLLPQ